MSMQLKLWQ